MSLKYICRVIFIFPYSPTVWDAQKFGFNYFFQANIDLQVLDMSALVSTRSQNGVAFLNEEYIKKIISYEEFTAFVRNNTNQAIFMDGINAIGGLKWQSRHIFRILKKYNVDYCIVELGALPIFAESGGLRFYQKIKKAFAVDKLLAYVKWKFGSWLIHWQWKYLNLYHLPLQIFSGNSESLARYLQKYRISKSKVTSIHSYDYDRYLIYLRNKPKSLFPKKKIAVFLDQMLPFHSDFGNNVSFNPVTAENYYPSLSRFFEKVENQFGLKVVIASSPRANYENNRILFDAREVVMNKTIELVAESELVLMHTSTAVSFAVLFNKPILMLKTNEMLDAAGFTNFMNKLSCSLGLLPIRIDDPDFKLNSINNYHKNYDNYKYKYIMTKNLQDRVTWEIIIDNIIKLSKTRLVVAN